MTLFSALGRSPSPPDWLQLPAAEWAGAPHSAPAPAAWLALSDASHAKRIGETVLTALLVAAPEGPLSADPVALFTGVSGLRQIGLETDARRLAVEAALGASL